MDLVEIAKGLPSALRGLKPKDAMPKTYARARLEQQAAGQKIARSIATERRLESKLPIAAVSGRIPHHKLPLKQQRQVNTLENQWWVQDAAKQKVKSANEVRDTWRGPITEMTQAQRGPIANVWRKDGPGPAMLRRG